MKSDIEDDADSFAEWQDNMTNDLRRINEQSIRMRCLQEATRVVGANSMPVTPDAVLRAAKEFFEWVSEKPNLPPLEPVVRPKYEDIQ